MSCRLVAVLRAQDFDSLSALMRSARSSFRQFAETARSRASDSFRSWTEAFFAFPAQGSAKLKKAVVLRSKSP
jgi:hypothetical protein